MSPQQLTSLDVASILPELRASAPARIAEMIAEQRALAADALERIAREGTVVRTLKGDVIAHPAIRIHAEATKAEQALLEKHAKPRG